MAGNLKEVRTRISSVKNTQQITKAMKVVSAAKLRKAQQAITQMRPYADKLNEMLMNILSNLDGDVNTSYGVERPVENALIVVVTSSKGLCGAFNTNVIKAAQAAIEDRFASVRAKGNLSVLCIGKKGYDIFRKMDDITVIDKYVGLFSDLNFVDTSVAAESILEAFDTQKYDAVEVAYGQFKNAGSQICISTPFLPVPKIEQEEGAKGKQMRADYIFEPDKDTLLEKLIPSILKTQFFKYLLDTHASEHGARMTAMDKATENAEDLLRELKIFYNKARQEAITNEISEIVGGVAALEG